VLAATEWLQVGQQRYEARESTDDSSSALEDERLDLRVHRKTTLAALTQVASDPHAPHSAFCGIADLAM
jgi:uncharacterized protein (UPF0147 family)